MDKLTKLTKLELDLEKAQDELYHLEMSDDFCYTNGRYNRAMQKIKSIEKDLARYKNKQAA